MLQAFQSQTEHAKGNLDLDEGGQRLAQVRSHQNLAGHTGSLVDATGKAAGVFAAIAPGVGLHLLEGFGGANNGAVQVAYGNGAEADRNFVSSFVVQEADGFCRMRSLDGAGNRAIVVAEFTTGLITVQ